MWSCGSHAVAPTPDADLVGTTLAARHHHRRRDAATSILAGTEPGIQLGARRHRHAGVPTAATPSRPVATSSNADTLRDSGPCGTTYHHRVLRGRVTTQVATRSSAPCSAKRTHDRRSRATTSRSRARTAWGCARLPGRLNREQTARRARTQPVSFTDQLSDAASRTWPISAEQVPDVPGLVDRCGSTACPLDDEAVTRWMPVYVRLGLCHGSCNDPTGSGGRPPSPCRGRTRPRCLPAVVGDEVWSNARHDAVAEARRSPRRRSPTGSFIHLLDERVVGRHLLHGGCRRLRC